MEFLFAIPLLLLPFIMPVITGCMAKSFGRRFWPWFFLGIPLPFVAIVILLCLPQKKKKVIVPVANDEIFDQLFNYQSTTIFNQKRINSKKHSHEQHFSAQA